MRRIHQSVSRCLGAGAAGLWDVIHVLFLSIVCVYIRARRGRDLCTAALTILADKVVVGFIIC